MQQSQQRVDTVRVMVPRLADSVKVRITSAPRDTVFVQVPGTLRTVVELPDSLHATTRQVGGWVTALPDIALAVALILVTIWAHRRSHRVEVQNVELQRQFNETQVQHEQERRDAELQREEAQRRATDARISGIAFALRRQLISWIGAVSQAMNALVTIADEFARVDKQHGGSGTGTKFSMPSVADNIVNGAIQWARERQSHFNRAEERMLQLVAAAPDGTEPVAESVRRVYVLFFQATSRLNQQVAKHQEGAVVEPLELATAFHEFEHCVIELGIAVGPELLKTEVLMAEKDWSKAIEE